MYRNRVMNSSLDSLIVQLALESVSLSTSYCIDVIDVTVVRQSDWRVDF
jgi:hypothetical protein